jgi:cytochrome bd-type quinol oxidase subunit 2
MNRILGDASVILIALILLIFVSFYTIESGDMDVVMLGTILYMPYAFVLVLYTVLFQAGLRKFKRSRIEEIFLPLIPLIGWMTLSRGSIEIRYWQMEYVEMAIVLSVLALANAINTYRHPSVKGL